MKALLIFHHVGTLVDDMENAVTNYKNIFGQNCASPVIYIESQKVSVCFIRIADNSFIELVQSRSEDSKVFNLLKKRVTYYHIGYKTDDIEVAVAELEEMGFRAMEYFYSEAFEGKRCIFLFSPEAHLFELIES